MFTPEERQLLVKGLRALTLLKRVRSTLIEFEPHRFEETTSFDNVNKLVCKIVKG